MGFVIPLFEQNLVNLSVPTGVLGNTSSSTIADQRCGMKALKKILVTFCASVLALWLFGLLLFRFISPPLTLTMVIGAITHGQWIKHDTVSLRDINPSLQGAVIAAEDVRFCIHHGIDVDAVQDAIGDFNRTGRLRGASTLSMQVARNVFLWTGGGFVRKALEAPLALTLDAVWSKRHVMEIYLNIAEWGPGVFGAEAAAQYYFHKHASALSRAEAARLAVILPNPVRWNAAKPTGYILQRSNLIASRMRQLSPNQLDCLSLAN